MKIGIYLAYPPLVELASQGLGRQLVQLVTGLAEDPDVSIVLLTPSWSKKSVRDLLSSVDDETGKITFLAPKKAPVSLRVLSFLRSRSARRFKRAGLVAWARGVARASQKVAFAFVSKIAGSRSIVVAALLALLAAPFFLAGLVLAFVVGAVSMSLRGLARIVMRRAGGKSQAEVRRAAMSALGTLLNYRAFARTLLGKKLFDRMTADESILMAKIANSADCDIWFSPTAFWPDIALIKGVVAVCVPDLSPTDFPVAYATKYPYVVDVVDRCLRTVRSQRYFITYSETVAQKELVEKRGVSRSAIFDISHAPNRLDRHIDVMGTMDAAFAKWKFANSLIEGYRNVHFQGNPYLKNFSFTDVKYLFFPSQIRPNKNILNLIRALEIVVRKRHRYVKLFLTCNLSLDEEVSDYIESRRLQYEIISFREVPEQVLAALYHRAELVVNPSLFEGGFPFTFAEGLSVGTPSVQADLPEARAFLRPELADQMLFDPYTPEDIADVITWALDNRQTLLEAQLLQLSEFEHPDWEAVAKRYLAVFREIIGLSKPEIEAVAVPVEC